MADLTIVHRLGMAGSVIDDWLRQLVPDAAVVSWPEHGDVLVTYDGPWREGGVQSLPDSIRWVHILGAGVGGFPFQLLEGRPLTCSKGASSVPIAEWVLAMMLAFEKRLPDSWISAPPPQWNAAALGSLAGKTLGLVGLGAIGSEVARRAVAFDMSVLAVRRSDRPSPVAGVRVVPSLEEALPSADHVVLTAPSTPETHHLIGPAALAAMKDGVHLVNIARGALVDQDALLAALDAGKVAVASLDVVEPEPLPAGHPFYTHPRVRLSPHISWSAPLTMEVTMRMFLDNLERYRRGEPLQGLVDVEAGY